jgi:hypothetical protein
VFLCGVSWAWREYPGIPRNKVLGIQKFHQGFNNNDENNNKFIVLRIVLF